MFFFFKQKTAYEMRISDWSSDVCSSDLCELAPEIGAHLLTVGEETTFLVEAQHFEPDRRADGMARIGHAVSHRDARGGVVRDGAIYAVGQERRAHRRVARGDRKSTRLNSSH